MTEASKVAAAPTGHSLLDDVSTINNASDADETLATEDTFPLRHESDKMFPERQSDHSRFLTDDDDQSFNTWSTKRDQRLGCGGSSVNTGSTYEETPFLPRVEESPKPLQKVPEQEAISPTSEQREDEQVTNTVQTIQSDGSRANDGDGYACEMIFETQAMLQQARAKAGSCFMGLFQRDGGSREHPDSSSVVLTTVNGVLGAASDNIDQVLIKLFDVPNPDVDANPKYAVSLNKSLTHDYRHVLDAAAKSISYPKRSKHSRSKTEVKPDSSVSSSSSFEAPKLETYLVPISDESKSLGDEDVHDDNKSLDDVPDEKDSVQDEHSDIRDDLDEVLSDSYVATIKQTDTHDSVAKFKESLYAGLMDKRESNSTASSIDSDIKREKNVVEQGKSGSDRESVARVLDKYMQSSSLAPRFMEKNQLDFVDLVDDEEWGGQLNVSALHKSHVTEFIQKNQLSSQHAMRRGEKSDDEVSLSALHKRHVVDLINKHIASTNRSNFVDLSSIDAVMEDSEEKSSLMPRDSKSKSAGRSWHSSTVLSSTHAEATESTERSWHSSSFAEVEEIDKTLNMRREKLRKMMDELNVSLGNAEKVIILERREASENSQRDGQSEDRAILALETSHDSESPEPLATFTPIDLTLYDECL